MGSPLNHKLPVLSQPSPKGCSKKVQRGLKQGPLLQTDGDKGQRTPLQPTDSEMHLSDLYTLAPSEADTLPYTKDAPSLSGEPQPPSTGDSERSDKTLEPSDVSVSSWITSTPLPAQAGSVQLSLRAGEASQSVTYTKNSEERLGCEHAVSPAHRTEPPAERSLHAAS